MSSKQVFVSSMKKTALVALCIAFSDSGVVNAANPLPAACNLVDASQQEFVMQVPFEVVDGRIYLQATVNNRGPYRFALDTGASGLGRADASLVSALGLEIHKPVTNSDGVKTSEADTTHIKSLEVGGLSRQDLQVITRDYNSKMSPESAFSGIIAREFFSDGLLVIDYPRKMLSFSKTLSLSAEQKGALLYERPFRVPVSIGDLRTVGNLDTGANVTFVLPQSLFEKLPASPTQKAGKGQLSNSQVETKRALVHGPFQIGEATLSDVEVRVAEKYPELLVGAHVLQSFVVLIDQRSKSVALCR
jgi:predicted aspartyl protease